MKRHVHTKARVDTKARLALAGLTSAALICAAVPAFAQEATFTEQVLSTLGVIDANKPVIKYRERPPLVVPPKMTLPPPTNTTAALEKDPAWPKDPDVMAAKKAAAEARKPRMMLSNSQIGRPLSPGELMKGRSLTSRENIPGGAKADNDVWISPAKLKAMSDQVKLPGQEANIASGVEPPRLDLTDPPPGYRVTTNGKPVKLGSEGPRKTVDDRAREAADPYVFIRQENEDK